MSNYLQLSDEFFDQIAQRIALLLAQQLGQTAPQPEWLTPQETMEMLNVTSPVTMQNIRDDGRLKFTYITPRKVLYNRQSILDYLESKSV
ncbi:helix-turn-helix domain-containing protein [Fulvivirga lutea]|uniref:Helix-turn-helix domain-containing protein n=1 Tax=Fulvivirga lutea TaxID=2810512 RepID=A0A974WHH9_9BACT|nr:helix-turn-helix domain-containing protein [Fulvivirga lutea]QSE98639.1 helix-turn-helix domain-containing protein [Fulvivirga lutea]